MGARNNEVMTSGWYGEYLMMGRDNWGKWGFFDRGV